MVVCLKNSRKHISAAMAVLSPTSIAKKERKKATVGFQISVEVWRVAGRNPSRIFRGGSPAWMAIPTDVVSHTDLVVGGMWRCRPGHLKYRRTASGCSQRWHHREVWWLRLLAWFKYHVDIRKEQTFFPQKINLQHHPRKSMFHQLMPKVSQRKGGDTVTQHLPS